MENSPPGTPVPPPSGIPPYVPPVAPAPMAIPVPNPAPAAARAPVAATPSNTAQYAAAHYAAPHTTAQYAAAPHATAPYVPQRRRHALALWVTVAVLIVILIGLLWVTISSAIAARAWEDRVDELTGISKDLGSQVADERAQRKAAEAQIDEVQSQLDTLKARVTDLANEEANAIDTAAAFDGYVDAAMICANERGKLIDGYGSMWRTEDGRTLTTAGMADEITAYCTEVQANIDDFRAGQP